MDNRGQAMALAGIVIFMLMVFICYMAYSIFEVPTTQIISSVDNSDTDNTIPSSVIDNISMGANYWPLIFIIVGFIVMVALIYKKSERLDPGYSQGGY